MVFTYKNAKGETNKHQLNGDKSIMFEISITENGILYEASYGEFKRLCPFSINQVIKKSSYNRLPVFHKSRA